MHIALCDEDSVALDHLEHCLRGHAEGWGLSVALDRFACGEAFLASPESYDAIFMGIHLPGITGLETVRRLPPEMRQRLVFITDDPGHAVEAFALGVAHYLVKPPAKEDVLEALARCLARPVRLPERTLSVRINHKSVQIPMDHIIYIEVFNKLSVIHTIHRDVETYASLDALYSLLDADAFLRVQRSFIVNLRFVETFLFDHVILTDGTRITLSRTNRAAMKRQYQQFRFDLTGRSGEYQLQQQKNEV